jgi:hypothetical protein
MKTLRRWFLVISTSVLVIAAWLRESPYWTLWRVHQGLATRDVALVEEFVALERFAASSSAALGGAVSSGVAGGGIGAAMASAIGELVGRGLGEVVAPEAARMLREQIAGGSLEKTLGPFVVHDGLSAVGRVGTTIDGAQVELQGTCRGHEASLVLDLVVRAGPILGHPRHYVIVGIDPASARSLATQCIRGA